MPSQQVCPLSIEKRATSPSGHSLLAKLHAVISCGSGTIVLHILGEGKTDLRLECELVPCLQ